MRFADSVGLVRVELVRADESDAESIWDLRAAVAEALTRQFGKGHWSSSGTVKGVLRDLESGGVFVAREQKRVIAALTLGTRKPWAIDRSYFTECATPLYLTNMAVHPDVQRKGIGRQCVALMQVIAREWPSGSIRLDAYDVSAGASGFYERCGFKERGRVTYRGTPLVYFEMLL